VKWLLFPTETYFGNI